MFLAFLAAPASGAVERAGFRAGAASAVTWKLPEFEVEKRKPPRIVPLIESERVPRLLRSKRRIERAAEQGI